MVGFSVMSVFLYQSRDFIYQSRNIHASLKTNEILVYLTNNHAPGIKRLKERREKEINSYQISSFPRGRINCFEHLKYSLCISEATDFRDGSE